MSGPLLSTFLAETSIGDGSIFKTENLSSSQAVDFWCFPFIKQPSSVAPVPMNGSRAMPSEPLSLWSVWHMIAKGVCSEQSASSLSGLETACPCSAHFQKTTRLGFLTQCLYLMESPLHMPLASACHVLEELVGSRIHPPEMNGMVIHVYMMRRIARWRPSIVAPLMDKTLLLIRYPNNSSLPPSYATSSSGPAEVFQFHTASFYCENRLWEQNMCLCAPGITRSLETSEIWAINVPLNSS